MVQNFAHFQQFCHLGAGGNFFADSQAIPRREAACAVCAQKHYLEHRYKLSLFGEIPAGAGLQPDASEEEDDASSQDAAGATFKRKSPGEGIRKSLVQHKGIYYVQCPDKVHRYLDVQRYAQRWPLIPREELHASSIQHPTHPEWRWLLHSCRVPIIEASGPSSGATQPAATEDLPPCAGVGDPDRFVWACWGCMSSLCLKKPLMPLDACVNDNWIGRKRQRVREASEGTKMLSSLARCCWKQVRLGRGSPDVQQKAIAGNSIFFAQPTADIPSMEMPPPSDALVDSFNVVFTRSVSDLSRAHWAIVNRQEYLRIVRERKHSGAWGEPVRIELPNLFESGSRMRSVIGWESFGFGSVRFGLVRFGPGWVSSVLFS